MTIFFLGPMKKGLWFWCVISTRGCLFLSGLNLSSVEPHGRFYTYSSQQSLMPEFYTTWHLLHTDSSWNGNKDDPCWGPELLFWKRTIHIKPSYNMPGDTLKQALATTFQEKLHPTSSSKTLQTIRGTQFLDIPRQRRPHNLRVIRNP